MSAPEVIFLMKWPVFLGSIWFGLFGIHLGGFCVDGGSSFHLYDLWMFVTLRGVAAVSC